METNDILVVSDLCKSYGKKEVLKGVNFSIKSGEIFGFIGRNGIGKSTTIKCVCNIINYNSGEILIDGYNLIKQPIEAKRSFGLVLDDCYAYEEMTGKEYIIFVASIYKVSQEDFVTRYNELVQTFDLKNDMDQLIKFYSHGMKQKISIIASLIHDPKLWILDEPLTGLDIITVKSLIETMRKFVGKGHSVFITSHNIDMVEDLCDRVAFIDEGKIVSIFDLHNKPSTGFSLQDEFFNIVQKESV